MAHLIPTVRRFADLIGICAPTQGGTGLDATTAPAGMTLQTTGTGYQFTSPTGGGTGGDLSYIHIQSTPAASWTITHGLGKHPSVTVVDSAQTEVIGDVTYIDANSLRVDFNGGFSGNAYLN